MRFSVASSTAAPRAGAWSRAAPAAGLPVELAFLAAHGVPLLLLREVARRAARVGVSPSRQLIAENILSETEYYRILAKVHGLAFAGDGVKLRAGGDLAKTVAAGITAVDAGDGRFVTALSPSDGALRRWLAGPPAPRDDVVVMPPSAFAAALREANADRISHVAAWEDAAGRARPCAEDGASHAQLGLMFLLAALGGFWGYLEPYRRAAVFGLAVAPAFLVVVLLRLAAIIEALRPELRQRAGLPVDDSRLPVYTVAVAIFREEEMLPQLIPALAALDYPHAKLDVRILVEARDLGLQAALAARVLPPFIGVTIVPEGLPHTKPRALNVGLAEARGELFTVYDAEDVPDPLQLRRAAARFLADKPDLACLQGHLVIDNTPDGWLPGLFALEYAGLFDVTNPGLLRCGAPILLGGTSNHFRTDVLRALGGWDAWNVTEDADMAVRLARAGYRIDDLASDTLERAPKQLPAWVKQRQRWLKGYMQTLITHLRHPRLLLRQAGWLASLSFLALALGTVASALLYPFVGVAIGIGLLRGAFAWPQTPFEYAATTLAATVSLLGTVVIFVPPALGAWRRGAGDLWRLLPLLPLYYLLVSLAAWLAVKELVVSPHSWNKTHHAATRSSRYQDKTALTDA